MRAGVSAALAIIYFFYGMPSGLSKSNFSSRPKDQVIIEAPLSTYTVGEKFTYEVSWLGVPVGIGLLEVREKGIRNGREAFHLVALAKTNDFLSKLYPVEDEIHSWVDAENFFSLEFSKTLKEGRYRADERIQYDTASKKGFYESLKNKSRKEFPIEGPVHDLLSAFFWFRLQPVKTGDVIRTSVNGEDKTWSLELSVLNTEMKELRGSWVYPTIRVEPKTRLKGVLYNRGRAWVHFTSDARRIPLCLTVQTRFGPVVGVLLPNAS